VKRWVAALVASITVAVLAPAQARSSLRFSSLVVERGAVVCVNATTCNPAFPRVPKDLPLGGRHLCLGSSLADTSPQYECRVTVGGTLTGFAALDALVLLRLTVTSDDGNPWGDDVRRTLRGQSALTQSPGGSAPAACSVIPAVDNRVTCARIGPRSWSASTVTTTETGLYSIPLAMTFPATTGTEKTCESLRIVATARTGGKTSRVDLGRKTYCA
jgi:hypothetical protein